MYIQLINIFQTIILPTDINMLATLVDTDAYYPVADPNRKNTLKLMRFILEERQMFCELRKKYIIR